jgi:hypothetical protein
MLAREISRMLVRPVDGSRAAIGDGRWKEIDAAGHGPR